MIELKEHFYQPHEINSIAEKQILLAADIGGTNANFGIFSQQAIDNNQYILLATFQAKSQQIPDFNELFALVIERIIQLGADVTAIVVAAAGVISADRKRVKPTNLPFTINIDEIAERVGVNNVVLANDFEVIGYGIAHINPINIVTINRGNERPHAHKVILGAGTGLGKATLIWNKQTHAYRAIASEGGHADLVIHHHHELDLAHFIQQKEGFSCPLSWEDVLSGAGISRLYNFFAYQLGKDKTQKVRFSNNGGPRADEIFAQRNQDEACFKTYEVYTQLYGRCAKNIVLEMLALGGLYIAGGIAAHNVQMFQQPVFMQEFMRCGKQELLLQDIPVHIIADYNVSLYGAAAFYVIAMQQ